MSPGPTFERVYLALKGQLRAGLRPPGSPLEPSLIGDELGTSFTPVRDALHRLVGEGLVETPRHNGFAVPLPTEQALRDLYAWNGDLIGWLGGHGSRPGEDQTEEEAAEADDPELAATLFQAIANQSPNREHGRAVAQLNDRLAPYRTAEAKLLTDIAAEARALRAAYLDRNGFSAALKRYHRRRIALVPQILSTLSDP